jgi:glycosyltransferase involved in cell wall biosynthesis
MLSTHLIFVSEDNRSEARSLGIGPKTPNSLIHSGIRVGIHELPSPIRRELGIPESAWLVITVGNFKPQKNPMDLIRVAAIALRGNPDLRFLLVGDGHQRPQVEAFVREQGIHDHVHFLGWRRDIPGLLAASNTFLLTSLWEGLPRAILEASIARLPSVAYGVNGVRDILKNDENGFLINPGDVNTAAEKVVWLAGHAVQARLMGEHARLKIQKEFDIDYMVRQQETLYVQCEERVPLKEYYRPAAQP